MPRQPVEFIVLCEDIAHGSFVRGYVKRRFGAKACHGVRVIKCNGGAGDDFVRRRYPTELIANRRRASSALIVVLDADSLELEKRLRQLRDVLEHARVPPPGGDERVCILVPRRNIETWIAYLVKQLPVDEVTDYKDPETGPLARRAGELLAENPKQDLPAGAPPSLERGRIELRASARTTPKRRGRSAAATSAWTTTQPDASAGSS